MSPTRRVASLGLTLFGAVFATGAFADPVVAPNGADAYFVLGWSAAADKRCGLNTYRILLQLAKSKGLSDVEIAQNISKIADAIIQVDDEIKGTGRERWCSAYQKGILTGH
jgi:hypothetical protein